MYVSVRSEMDGCDGWREKAKIRRRSWEKYETDFLSVDFVFAPRNAKVGHQIKCVNVSLNVCTLCEWQIRQLGCLLRVVFSNTIYERMLLCVCEMVSAWKTLFESWRSLSPLFSFFLRKAYKSFASSLIHHRTTSITIALRIANIYYKFCDSKHKQHVNREATYAVMCRRISRFILTNWQIDRFVISFRQTRRWNLTRASPTPSTDDVLVSTSGFAFAVRIQCAAASSFDAHNQIGTTN